jgi:hypothetical protein
MNLNRSFLYSIPVLAVLFGGSTALASPITVKDVGDSFTVALSGLSSDGDPVSVSESWEVTAVDATSITFDVTLDNTSATTSRLTAFAFDTNPNATGGSSGSSIYQHIVLDDGFDVCVENDSNSNCFGNQGNVGLLPADAADAFSLTLTFAAIGEDGVTFSNFFARLQAIGTKGGSAKIFGEPTCTSCEPNEDGDPDPDPVPEPISALLLTTAVGAFGLRRRARAYAAGTRTMAGVSPAAGWRRPPQGKSCGLSPPCSE